jgi:putative ABC transport system permease protein
VRRGDLIRRSLTFYWRTHLAVVAGVAIATAALCGALAVGDSVQQSLRRLAESRLGPTDYVLASRGFFRERLDTLLVPGTRSCPLIVLEATAIHERSQRRASNIAVYGVDERFFAFHSVRETMTDGLLLSPALAREFEAASGDQVLLRFEMPSSIPREFLHGRRESAAKALRLAVDKAVTPAGVREFSLRAQQGDVRAVFMPLARLQRVIGREGRVNTILLSAKVKPEAIAASLREVFQLEDVGLTLRPLDGGKGVALEHESTLLDDRVVRAVDQLGLPHRSYFTYLANEIRAGSAATPYSLVTATDAETLQALNGGRALPSSLLPPIVFTDWLAADLGVKAGASVTLEYFVWSFDGLLKTETADFELASIIPLAGAAVDRDVAPRYPGITDSESLAGWDPPFPIDLKRVRKKDEGYWKQYRTTPKAWIPLETGQKLWGTRYGRMTSVRFPKSDAKLESALRGALDPLAGPLSLISVREQNLRAASGSTDFGEYFVYFSFFLVASALLLTVLFFRLGVEQRLREIGLLRALGYTPAVLRRLFLTEGAILALVGVLLGILVAIGYAALLVYGLRTWWVDAVGTRLIELRMSAASVAIGAIGALVVALVSVSLTLRSLRQVSPRGLLAGGDLRRPSRFTGWLLPASFALGLLLVALAALDRIPKAAGFFGSGALLLVGCLSAASVGLRRGNGGIASLTRLGWRNAGWRPGRSVLCMTLIASATFLLVALEAFRSRAESPQGTGGFPLMAESQAPLIFDPNTPEGRDAFNLVGTPQARWEMFRLRPGDDVSCLNLYQPKDPRILGARSSFLAQGRFSFAASLASAAGERRNPWLLLDAPAVDGVIPAAADQNSITYILHKKLGDEVRIEREGAAPVRLRLVAALEDSVFQSEILIAERQFVKLFPEYEGYRVFLIGAPPAEAGMLEDALSDYGLDAYPAADRQAAYHRVENTYISTFQALGAFGLLLGVAGLAAVLLRNTLERRRELALLRAVGYSIRQTNWVVLAENLVLLALGLAIGLACAAVAVIPAVSWQGRRLPLLGLAGVAAAIFAAGCLASWVSARVAVRGPLLDALRAE